MEKTYRTDLTCFLGDEEKESVEGTLMGVMMEAGFRAQELPFRHAAFSIKEGGLKRAMDAVRCLGIRGAYLAPVHRADVLSCLDELSAAARLTGQADAVFCLDGRLMGENTGGKGFVTSLMEEGIILTGKTLTILGTGDAARAAVVEAALSGISRIYITGKDEEQGQTLARLLTEHTRTEASYIFRAEGEATRIPEDTDIVLRAEAKQLEEAGPQPEEKLRMEEEQDSPAPGEDQHQLPAEDDGAIKSGTECSGIRSHMIVCDMALSPRKTAFLKQAEACGAKTVGGLEMFVNQAVLTYSLWTEHIAPRDIFYDAALRVLDPEDGQEDGGAEPAAETAEAADRRLIEKMMDYYAGDPKRIQHFLKVYTFAKMIGEEEALPPEELFVLRTAAIVHDIGIRVSEEKYGSSAGKYQEKEGPAVAEPLLLSCGYEEEVIDRVLFLIANHHTYDRIEGADYQILVEADFLVNLYEDGCSRETAENVKRNIFRTKAGIRCLEQMYLNIQK